MKVDFTKAKGKIKIMHAVNNGPLQRNKDQLRNNFESYKALKIPYARNHDAAFFAGYGGSHTVDVMNIFPDFNADVNDPASYDFVLTDNYIENTLDAGTETFYRLGTKIEHEIKKYGTLPPPDFRKWAEICEHIIRHINCGWADGHHYGITYWEIWNEADMSPDDADPYWKKCWGGTRAQFYDFYETAAKHLKECFPELKIGGPAYCSPGPALDDFLRVMSERNVPIDFVSWHGYITDPADTRTNAVMARERMDKYGYTDAENIYDEWNYVEGWSEQFVASIETIIGYRGAAFSAANMIVGQNSPLDMMMYYDARPSVFNGLWDFYTQKELHGYYPFLMYSLLYSLGTQYETVTDEPCLYALAAGDGNGRNALMLASYSSDKTLSFKKKIRIELNGIDSDKAKMTITDKNSKCLEKEIQLAGDSLETEIDEACAILIEFM